MKTHSEEKNALYTEKEGQYLAFISCYTKLNRMAPAEADFRRYFRVSPPTIHQMILRLEKKGFINRFPNSPRSITLHIPEDKLPKLN